MEYWLFWIILFALAVIIGNQTRERQERETKGMTKKQKDKYFQDIEEKQKELNKKVWGWLIAFIIFIIFIFVILITL
jgi:Mg2+/citrate symporter